MKERKIHKEEEVEKKRMTSHVQQKQQDSSSFHLPKINTNANIINLANNSNNANKFALKEKIPIVRHLIRDTDLFEDDFNGQFLDGNQRDQKLNPIELEKIIKLFVDPHSVDYLIFFE